MGDVWKAEACLTRGRAEVRDGYRWLAQDCPVCRVPPSKYLGRRGGVAHRAGLGVECEVWRCGSCGLIFPNPMPVPVGGVEQHYALDPASYFRHHDSERKLAGARQGLMHAELLAGGRPCQEVYRHRDSSADSHQVSAHAVAGNRPVLLEDEGAAGEGHCQPEPENTPWCLTENPPAGQPDEKRSGVNQQY